MSPPSPEANLREAARLERVKEMNERSAERDHLLEATRAEQESIAKTKRDVFAAVSAARKAERDVMRENPLISGLRPCPSPLPPLLIRVQC